MKTLQIMIIVAGIFVFISTSALAGTNDPRIQRRQLNQQQRIDQGIQSGRLTRWEAGRLEFQQARIQQKEARMKADGTLTARERRVLNRDQNRASRTVFRKKHNHRGMAVQ